MRSERFVKWSLFCKQYAYILSQMLILSTYNSSSIKFIFYKYIFIDNIPLYGQLEKAWRAISTCIA